MGLRQCTAEHRYTVSAKLRRSLRFYSGWRESDSTIKLLWRDTQPANKQERCRFRHRCPKRCQRCTVLFGHLLPSAMPQQRNVSWVRRSLIFSPISLLNFSAFKACVDWWQVCHGMDVFLSSGLYRDLVWVGGMRRQPLRCSKHLHSTQLKGDQMRLSVGSLWSILRKWSASFYSHHLFIIK